MKKRLFVAVGVAGLFAALTAVQANPGAVSKPSPALASTLRGNWVPVNSTCTPRGGVSETALWFSPADQYSGETISGPGWSCTFPRKGIVAGSRFSGQVSCGFGEGIEGNRGMTLSIAANGILNVVSQASTDSEGGEIQGWSGSYKKCAQRLKSPY